MIVFFFFLFDEETDTTVPVSVDDSDIENAEELEFITDDTIRKVWNSSEEQWYFSIVDVCQYLTDSSDVKQYIKKMRQRDPELNSNWGTICTPIKMPTRDGKMRTTQAANIQGMLRLIQSIPSKKAEPLKQWLAKVGAERLDEMADPELAMQRSISYYKAKGYTESWISQRMRSIEIRKDLTDEWQRSGISSSKEYATLTNILTHAWSGITVPQYKKMKGLHKENLRDNMTNTELALNQLAEVATTELSRATHPQGFDAAKDVTLQGGEIAGNARKDLEKRLGHSVLSSLNAQSPLLLDEQNKDKT